MRVSYATTDDSVLLTTDEVTLLERLDEETEPDAMIAGNPWTGTSLALAYAGRAVVTPHILSGEFGESRLTVIEDLREASTDPRVCEAANELNVRYVLDFGEQEVHGARHEYPGLEDLDTAAGFELMDEQGEAKLYKLTACG